MNKFCLQCPSRYYFVIFFNEVTANMWWPAAQDATCASLWQAPAGRDCLKGQKCFQQIVGHQLHLSAGAQKQQRMEEHSKRTPFPSTNCRLPPPPQLEELHKKHFSAGAPQKTWNSTEGKTGGEEGRDQMLTQTQGQPRISPWACE